MNGKVDRVQPDLTLERGVADAPVCGVDEVGRGPWAGPLVAAAVILDPSNVPDGIRDSKQLNARQREGLYEVLLTCCLWSVGSVGVAEIDRLGLTAANDLAMRRAVLGLRPRPAFALVDGRRLPPDLGCPGRAVIGGDALSLSIAAASIIAKVSRDATMRELAERYPGYGWERNAGYGVFQHREALRLRGVTPQHRRSFKPVAEIISQENLLKS